MNLPESFDLLIAESQKSDLYHKLVAQLNKDFALANLDLEFSEEILPESLKYLLHEAVFGLLQNRFDKYLNLLYIIDVPEHKVKALDGSDILKLSEQVSFLILQREWQKVVLKKRYS